MDVQNPESGVNRFICGGQDIPLDGVCGRTVAEIQGRLREVLNLTDEHRVVLVNGRPINDPQEHKIAPGEEIEFQRPAGKKG